MKENYPEVRIDQDNKIIYLPYTYKVPQDLIKEWRQRGYMIQLEIV